MELISRNLTKFTENPLDYIDPNIELEVSWRKATKLLYDFLKNEEKDVKFLQPKNVLCQLHIDELDSEQIWQQVELQNRELLETSTRISDNNLCVQIAKLSNTIKDELDGSADEGTSSDEGVEMADEEDADADLSNEDDDDDLEDDLNSEEGEDSIKEENETLSDLEENDNPDIEFSDLDADTFGDIAVESDVDEEENENTNSNKDQFHGGEDVSDPFAKKSSFHEGRKKFAGTPLDSQFLNVRESEWIADNDILGENNNAEDEDIDYMADIEDQSDDEAQGAMYDAFFDAPDSANTAIEPKKGVEEIEPSDKEQEKPKPKSAFEEDLARNSKVREALIEENYIVEKPWTLKGEAHKDQRPENSTLEESLEYIVSVRQKPIITQETTELIEKVILSRIKTKAWDDVERKIKPQIDPFQYKKKLVLDQEKSSKSLAQIYEEEYIKKQEEKESNANAATSSVLVGPLDVEEELPVHKEIKEDLKDIFMKLDALSNFHYTPKFINTDIKVVSNLPAVVLEESTPTTASDATLLAPQEIMAPLKGDLKGQTERTSTDKKRERRMKKIRQKEKGKLQEEKLNHSLKRRGKDGLLNEDASVKVVQKAMKKGQVKMLEGDEKSSKSSTSFFSQLQDKVSSQTTKRKFDGKDDKKSKKKKAGQLTVSKLLL